MATAEALEGLGVFIDPTNPQFQVPRFDSAPPSPLDFVSAWGLFWKELLLSLIYRSALGGTLTFRRDNYRTLAESHFKESQPLLRRWLQTDGVRLLYQEEGWLGIRLHLPVTHRWYFHKWEVPSLLITETVACDLFWWRFLLFSFFFLLFLGSFNFLFLPFAVTKSGDARTRARVSCCSAVSLSSSSLGILYITHHHLLPHLPRLIQAYREYNQNKVN